MFLMPPTNRTQKEKFQSGISIGFTKTALKFCTYLANPLLTLLLIRQQNFNAGSVKPTP